MLKVKSQVIKKPELKDLEEELILKFKPLVSADTINERFKLSEKEKEKEHNDVSGDEIVFFDFSIDYFKDDPSKEKFMSFVYTKKTEFLNGIKEEAKQIKTMALRKAIK